MAKAYLVAGRISSGKTTFARKLCAQKKAVLLSTDEITLAVFGQHIGEKHDEVVEKVQNYLFQKALEVIASGINVCLDWGFWLREERDEARRFFESRGIETEFYYVSVSGEEWMRRIEKRNRMILSDNLSAYYVDENLQIKFGNLFEEPGDDEKLVYIM